MAIAPTNMRPSFDKWIQIGYYRPTYSGLYVYCIHALKQGVHSIVDSDLANRLERYLEIIEIPLHDEFELIAYE